MKIRILGCAGTVSRELKTSSFLINETTLLDCGTICSVLSLEEISRLKNIFISHPHFDHIKGLPSLAETLIFMKPADPVTIYGSYLTLDAINQNVLNDIIWPDFSRIPTPGAGVIRYNPLTEMEQTSTEGLTITPYFLNKNYSDFGYLLDDGSSTLLYTSDIGADTTLVINGKVPDSLITEVSFPDEERELALMTGHLTPSLLVEILEKLPTAPKNIFISHIKTYFRDKIIRQLEALHLANLRVLHDEDTLLL